MAQRDERSLGELLGDLVRQIGDLTRQEIALARAETTARIRQTAQHGALIGVGGALAYGGALVLLLTAALVLIELGLEPWIATLAVGLVALLLGAALVLVGRDRLRSADLAPRTTIETLKEDAAWAKERLP